MDSTVRIPNIIRVSGSPYDFTKLRRYSSFFREFNPNNLVRNGDQEIELDVSTDGNYYEVIIDEPRRGRVSYTLSLRFCAMQELFNVLVTPDDTPPAFNTAVPYDTAAAMHPLLDEFGVDRVVQDRYHCFFPYFSSLSCQAAPHGNADRPYLRTRKLVDGRLVEKNYTGWEMVRRQLVLEGRNCSECGSFNPWIAPLNASSICTCSYYRNDEYKRSWTNPYFHDDNLWQRNNDDDDAARRQMD